MLVRQHHVQTRHHGEAGLRVRSCGGVGSLSQHRGGPTWCRCAPARRSRLARHDRERRDSADIRRVGRTVAMDRESSRQRCNIVVHAGTGGVVRLSVAVGGRPLCGRRFTGHWKHEPSLVSVAKLVKKASASCWGLVVSINVSHVCSAAGRNRVKATTMTS